MTTILYTPTTEQIKEIAKDNPDLLEQINGKIITSLKEEATKYITRNLNSTASEAYHNVYRRVERKFFEGNYPRRFTPEMEKSIETSIQSHLEEEMKKELDTYLQSPEFQRDMRSRIRVRMLDLVMKALDADIQAEAKKLTTI